jgi:hypothetical protein
MPGSVTNRVDVQPDRSFAVVGSKVDGENPDAGADCGRG